MIDFGINFNGNMPMHGIKEAARASEIVGFSHAWVGENTGFIHPFPIIAACLEYTEKTMVGAGIISPLRNRPLHILKGVSTLKEAYGPRIAVGLAPGDKYGLRMECIDTKNVLKTMESTVERLKKNDPDLPVFIGASGPKLLKLASKKADGVLLNYVYPKHIKWALKYLKKDIYKAVYGPSLLLPNGRLTRELRNSAAVVLAGGNPEFLRDMELSDIAFEMHNMIKGKKWDDLTAYQDLLLERFTISGDLQSISERIDEYRNLSIDQVIFGTPLSWDMPAIKKIGSLISSFLH